MLISPWISVWPNFFIVYFFPGSPCFLSSLLHPTIRETWPALTFFGLLDCYFCLCVWMVFFFVIEVVIVYFETNTNLLRSLRYLLESDKRKRNANVGFYYRKISDQDNSLRGKTEACRRYRTLQVLNIKFKSSFSPILLTAYPLAMFSVDVSFGVAVLKLYHVLPFVAYLFFPTVKIWTGIMIMLIMRRGGEMFQGSMALLEKWKSPPVASLDLETFNKAQALRRSHESLVKSFRPIVAKMGNYMRMTYQTATLHLQYLAQYTIQLLMLLQS